MAHTDTSAACDVSVVICTVNRPDMLRKAIDSVLRMNNRHDLDREILVVDNSAEGRWRDLVESLSKELDRERPGAGAMRLRYTSETRMSFAHARNAGVRETQGDLLAFLDDDEEASPDWLDELIAAMREYEADVVFGPVLPVFEGGGPPEWDPQGRYHTRDTDLPTGTEVDERGTGNVLVRRDRCLTDGEPFDNAMGTSGGEDIDFFLRLRRRGRRLIWCSTAPVSEAQPQRFQGLSHRSFRNFCQSQVYVKVQARNSDSPLWTQLKLMTSGAVQILVFSLPGALSTIFTTPLLVRARLKFFNGLGKLFWMLPARLYAKRY